MIKEQNLDIWTVGDIGQEYNVGYEINRGDGITWITGELVNYNYGNIIILNHDEKLIYHIPYKGVKWLLPRKNKKNDKNLTEPENK